MSEQATPAPWTWSNNPYPDGMPCITIEARENPDDHWCRYKDDVKQGFRFTGIMSEADARLIASAPDMLAALIHVEAIMSIVPPRTAKAEYLDALSVARAAIAKAEAEGQP